MMKLKNFIFLAAIVGALCGCSGSDSGDDEAGRKAAETTVKSVEELDKKDMPEQAKAQAADAMKQMEQRNQVDAAAAEGMRRAANGGK